MKGVLRRGREQKAWVNYIVSRLIARVLLLGAAGRFIMPPRALPSRVAFFGLGNMGLSMASNLSKAVQSVVAFDPTPAARDAALARGLEVAPSAQAAVSGASAVITMLPNGKAVSDLFVGDAKLLDLLGPDTTILDCSTTDAPTARSVSAAAQERGVLFVDSPVSGGTAAAAAATLSFMCGGTSDGFQRAEPVRILSEPSAGQATSAACVALDFDSRRGRSCQPWGRRFFMPGLLGADRWPRPATTCSWPCT